MVDLDKIMEQHNKKAGDRAIITGDLLKPDPPRVPIGVFAMDYASGGGIPLWASTCFWGAESAGKTTLCMSVAKCAKLICWKCFKPKTYCECSTSPLDMGVFWADAEGTFDRLWAESIGLKPADYYYALADYGEKYINYCVSALEADDCGLVILDSLAALIPESEFDADAEDQFIGIQARLIGRSVRRLKQRLLRERQREHPCTILFTNQMRVKIGQMFGNPETMSGGHAMKHEFSLLFRLGQISLNKKGTDAKYIPSGKDEKPIASRFSFGIKKHKIQTLRTSGQYLRLTEDTDTHPAGSIIDSQVILKYAKDAGVIKQHNKKWYWFDKPSAKLENIKAFLDKFPDAYLRTMQRIVEVEKMTRFSGTVTNAED